MSEHVLFLSYGKDSLACLGAIEYLGWPLDRIVHVEAWATDTIHADLPPMVEFKAKADRIIKERWGIEVEHISGNLTYEEQFYKLRRNKERNQMQIYGFPTLNGNWCNDRLKISPVKQIKVSGIQYLGIAADEPLRTAKHINKPNVKLPLVEIGWEEDYCGLWSQYNDLLSPLYTTASRGGCWFCHNQGVDQLRLLRQNYPEYWELLLKWDNDSPVTFKADGHTVHDFDRRFEAEDRGIIVPGGKFRWSSLDVFGMDVSTLMGGTHD